MESKAAKKSVRLNPKTELETEAKMFVIQKAIGPVIFDGLASLESYYL